ncbi:Endonuclease V [Arboricoccus pini]|uniref:Endonuclease V n=1 Tax=Arboricoccus pini TaxID=1963835 RepID=A0A212QRU5_9PROT|nr:endonuclease V [Arboricoccus pini]SNB62310.1 Endonuclease V [Arboricoccus pini]
MTPHDWSQWPRTAEEARAIQAQLAGSLGERPLDGPVRNVAGVDLHYDPARGLAFAAAVLLSARTLELVESAIAVRPIDFPYVSGLLSFREVPAAVEALGMLTRPPDLVVVDGQGLAHPTGLGFASHLGIITGLPTIGCAKSRLVGTHAEPALERGARAPLIHKRRIVGSVLRSKTGVRPLFISAGHGITLDEAVDWVLRTDGGRRLPEPTRQADLLSRCHSLKG